MYEILWAYTLRIIYFTFPFFFFFLPHQDYFLAFSVISWFEMSQCAHET